MNQEGEVTFRNNLVNTECLKGRNREAWQAQWVYRVCYGEEVDNAVL